MIFELICVIVGTKLLQAGMRTEAFITVGIGIVAFIGMIVYYQKRSKKGKEKESVWDKLLDFFSAYDCKD